MSFRQTKGTVKPFPVFDARKDCQRLRSAIQGKDEKTIIHVICYRSNEQRQEIKEFYKTMYGRDVTEELKSTLSWNLKDLIIALMRTPADFAVVELRSALVGFGTDEETLIEILCSRDNAEIREMNSSYLQRYGNSLEIDIKSDTSGDFKRFLVSIGNGKRPDSTDQDSMKAQMDAHRLFSAQDKFSGAAGSLFNEILCSHSFEQLRLIFDAFQSLSGKDITDVIKSKLSGDVKKGMLAIVGVIRSKPSFFADVLHASMKGLGTNDKTLIRVIVSRSEIDLVDIKRDFEKKYGQSLKSWITTEGTVKPFLVFDVKADCQRLRAAVGSKKADEKTIIHIICYRSNEQRQEIRELYKTMYGMDVIEEFKSALLLSWNFKNVIVALMRTPIEFAATELYSAMAGPGTDEEALIEVLCSKNNTELQHINEYYQQKYGHSLEKDIKGDTSGDFRRFLVSISSGKRLDTTNRDIVVAQQDAYRLKSAYSNGGDGPLLNEILCTHSFDQLRLVFGQFQEVSGKDITDAIGSTLSGDVKRGMLAMVDIIRNQQAYFADVLYRSMKGLGTNDKTLIRVLVSRSEIDLARIKQEFEKKYRKTLMSWITGDTSGNYRAALLALADP